VHAPMQVAAGACCGLQKGCMSATGARCCPPAHRSHFNGLTPVGGIGEGPGFACTPRRWPPALVGAYKWGVCQDQELPSLAPPSTFTSPGCPNQQYLAKLSVCCWQGCEQCALHCIHLGKPMYTQNTLFCHPSFSHPTHPRTSC
jgi:hypothetical protein